MTSQAIAITGWQAISALGVGAEAFGANAEPPAVSVRHPLHASADEFPGDIAYRPAYFNVSSLIGEKGIRTMDRTTALAVCTAKLLHGDPALQDGGAERSERTGFVLGTSTGSIRSTSDFTRESLVQERPFLVNPALFPNTVMNCAAGQCGIWFKARSVNATISGGRLSGLLALKYAAQTLQRRYADRLLTGSVEELCPQSAWAHRELVHIGRRHAVPLGEGCAMFVLERADDVRARGEQPLAEVLALQYGRCFDTARRPEHDPVSAVVECIGEALHRAGMPAGDVGAAVLCNAADPATGDIELRAARRVLGEGVPLIGPELVQRLGDTYSAGFSLGLAALLSRQPRDGGSRGALALAVGEDGHVGCLVLRA